MERFLVKVGISYLPYGRGERKEAAAGDVVVDLPKHGTDRCDSSCVMEGPHDWLLAQDIVELLTGELGED